MDSRIVRRVVSALAAFLAACGGSSSTAPSPSATLVVTLAQPPGASPLVVISGPNNYAVEVLGTDTLRGLAAGTYSVVSATATTQDPIVTPTDTGVVSGSPVTVAVNDTAALSITFNRVAGAGNLWVIGGSAGHGTATGYTGSQLLANAPAGLSAGIADGVAVFDTAGNLWVASPSGNSISEYTRPQLVQGGTPTPVTTITGGGLSGPDGLAFDRVAGLWVANGGGNTLVHYSAAQLAAGGAPTPDVVLSSAALSQPTGLGFDAFGTLWVPNATANTVIGFSAGQLAATGSPAPAVTINASAGSLASPQGVAFDQTGNLWVANATSSTIVRFSYAQQLSTGSPTPTLVFTLPAGTGSPSSIAFDNSGDLWGTSIAGSALFQYSAPQITSGAAASPASTISVPPTPRTVALDPVPDGLPVSGPKTLAAKLKGPRVIGRHAVIARSVVATR